MSAILKHLEDLLRFNTTRNMRFNNQVHKLRKRDCNVRFHVVLVLKQTICVFVSGSIASFTNRVPYRLFACVEAQAFNALEKVRPGSSKVFAKAFESNAQQDACRPRRIVKNFLSFAIWLLDGFWHVFGCRNADGLRPNEFSIFKKTVCAALRALSHAEVSPINRLSEVPKADLLVVKGNLYVYDTCVRRYFAYDWKGSMFAKGLAMRAGE